MLSPRPSFPLEYWFFKVNAGRAALIVDWIARRKLNEKVIRVSIHSPEKREVLFEGRPDLLTPQALSFLDAERTAGRVGEVEWELNIELGGERIAPQIFPVNQLRMPDMSLISAPLAAFSGWIRHGAYRVELKRVPGMVSHYWGRQLPREWWWVSANRFNQEDVAVECTVLRSGMWGIPIGIPLAYLYLHFAGRKQLWIAPPAMARASGSPESFEIEFRRPGTPPVRLIGQGRDYGDFGEGIVNTLVGDLEVWQGNKLIGQAQGTAGLERRFPNT